MKLFIPELGTQLELKKDASLKIQMESRNEDFLFNCFPKELSALGELRKLDGLRRDEYSTDPQVKAAAIERKKRREELWPKLKELPKVFTVKILAGTILEVDRIYVRKGQDDYSSVTFVIRDKRVHRFWVNLDQVNTLDVEILGKHEKWPDGVFRLRKRKSEYSRVDDESFSRPLKVCLYTQYALQHLSPNRGKTNISVFNNHEGKLFHKYYNSSSWNEYDTLGKLLAAARRAECPENLIQNFIDNYNKHLNDK
jgi:hypothetical protein